MFGFLPGITTPGGATHQAIEDAAIMRSLPNMTVLETGDATEVESVLELAYRIPGPVYVRMLRGEIPRLFDSSEPMRLDCPRVLSDGSDVAIFSSGVCTEEVMRAVKALAGAGIRAKHVHVSTLKPFDSPLYPSLLNAVKYGLITVENHIIDGGLGTIVAEKAFAMGVNKPIIKLGIRDSFSHGASKAYLMREHGIDAMAVVRAAEKLIGAPLGLDESDLAKVRIEKVHCEAKPEAL
jgi:transketolase